MFDFRKLFVRQSKPDNSLLKKVNLYAYLDNRIKEINFVLDEENCQFLSQYPTSQGTIVESKEKIFICLGEYEGNTIKYNIWEKMAKLYDKYIYQDVILGFEGDYSYDCVYSLVIKSYSYDFLKKEKTTCKLKIYSPENEKAIIVANAQNFARFLGDTPGNLMTPELMTQYIKKYLDNEKIALSVLEKEEIISENMNLIISVSQGSIQEPKLIHAKYLGNNTDKIDIAFVGKGVIFDTGGISLKPAPEMFKLKQDMMGAAICSCILKVIADMKLPINATITLPLVENMPGESATKPGDVFVSKSGLTVEVDNTDAEGRLILADAITFAQKDKPRFLFDIATLTGAVRIALGNVFGGYFTHSDEISSMINSSGKETGDELWRLPLSSFYSNNLKSNVSDVCNMSRSKSGAGGSNAAEFIYKFVSNKASWVHFDISNVRNNHPIKEIFGDQTTARPLPTLISLVEKIAKNNFKF